MFQVGRFDPRAAGDAEKKKKKKQQKQQEQKKDKKKAKKRNREESSSTLRVIAPEAKAIRNHKQTLTDEALDDFDVEPELLALLESKEDATTTSTADPVVENEENDETMGVAEEEPPKPDLPKDIAAALHMSTLPIEEAAKVWELAPFLVENLTKDGYQNFFPIQSLVIPDVIASERHSQILQCQDVCVAAPTGSGKTLAFCLPVLNSLSQRAVRRLRALVVLPSRDLAAQVFQVFERYAEGSDLTIGLAIGQSDFLQEQRALMVGPRQPMEDVSTLRLRQQLDPTNLDLALELHGQEEGPIDTNGAIDVLVATPGRLIDHIDKTPGFSLQHLRFLVIDEADRLVSQSYHSFVGRIMESVDATSEKAWRQIADGGLKMKDEVGQITWRRPPDSLYSLSSSSYSRVCQRVQLRKLLFSATMTKDPQKLASLGLVNPKYYDAHNLKGGGGGNSQRYAMPSGLSELMVECTAEQKPLFLLGLLIEHKRANQIVVVFTASLDSTHRLARLLQLLWEASGIGDASCITEFSSALNQTQRSSLVKRCNETKEISVIVCSDGLSRGMDIKSVNAVINYDVPSFAKTYVHRCGRTARAGREGTAISLLKGGQMHLFKKMRQLIENPSRVSTRTVDKELVRGAFAHYKSSVARLSDVIDAEKDGELSPVEPLPSKYFVD